MSFFSSTTREQRRLLQEAAEHAEQQCVEMAKRELLRQVNELEHKREVDKANRLIHACLVLAKSGNNEIVLGQGYRKQFSFVPDKQNEVLKVKNI